MRIAEKLIHYSLSSYRLMDNKEWFKTKSVGIFITALNKIVNEIAPKMVDEDIEEWVESV